MNYLKTILVGATVYVLTFWFAGPGGIISLPLLASLFVLIFSEAPETVAPLKGSKKKKSKKSVKGNALAFWQNTWRLSAMGAMTGLIGGLFAVNFLTEQNYIAYAQAMPEKINIDILGSVYTNLLYGMVRGNQINSMSAPLFVIGVVFLTGLFSFLFSLYPRKLKAYAPWAACLLICLMFLAASWQATAEFRTTIASEPQDAAYAYDGHIYLKTFYRMADTDFYHAYVQAAAADQRLTQQKAVQNGKFVGYIMSPLYFRSPVLFSLWRILSGRSAAGIYYLGLLGAVGVLALSWLAGRSLFGDQGVLLTAAVMPYLFMGVNWYNLFFPDWWASLALAAGVFFWLRDEVWPSATAFLAAAAFREITFVFMVLFVILSLAYKKEARLPFLVLTGVFLAVYPAHYLKSAQFIVPQASALGSVTSRLTLTHFLPTSSYLAFPYGFFRWPAWLLMAPAALVWAWRRRFDMLIVCLLAFPYFAYASSSYWGQHLLIIIIFSAFSALLLIPVGNKRPRPR